MTLRAPEPLVATHVLESFDSDEPSLDQWLKRRALKNQASGASRMFVVTQDGSVVGYYALASGAVDIDEASGRFRRNMPDPIPVIVLARLAVDRSWQGKGLARALMRDAGERIAQAADVIGIRGVIAHALNEDAHRFYLALGFEASPLAPMTVMMTLADLRAAL